MKKTITLALAILLMLSIFTACGKTEKPADDNVDVSAKPSDSATPVSDEPEEITEINYWLFNMGVTDKSSPVFAAINAITEEKIGVHVNFNYVDFGDYPNQLSLAIANKEQIDLCALSPVFGSSFLGMYSTNALMDITDLLNDYGADLKTLIGEDILKTTSVNGRQFAVPVYRIYNSNAYILYRKDVLEGAGVLDQYTNMTTWAEFEDVLAAVQGEGNTYAFGNVSTLVFNSCFSGTNLTDTYTYDTLGDSLMLVWSDQDGNIDTIYNRPEFVDMYKMMADWYKKGYIWPDSTFTTESKETLLSANVYAGMFGNSEFGADVQLSQAVGATITRRELAPGMITTPAGANWSAGIPVTAKEPEAAMKFLNLLYNDKELMNLLVLGIEGENYALNEDGEGIYLDGTDASTCGYHQRDFSYGNQFLVYPWQGQGGDFREFALENVLTAPISIYCGLTVDLSDISATVSALSAARAEYIGMINNGLYTDSLYAEYMDKLDAAGIDEYIATYKTAVEGFLA